MPPPPQLTTLTTNDIVINKLTQILSYLRQGARSGKKGRKRDRGLAKGIAREELPPEPPKMDDRYIHSRCIHVHTYIHVYMLYTQMCM